MGLLFFKIVCYNISSRKKDTSVSRQNAVNMPIHIICYTYVYERMV